ncbi:MAG: fibronectin type III domain-containing protein, partial [Lentisphaerae bacterium]|nr:fibronectin type III domain-containing protein [Lentisphaerota bacterium]
SSSAGSRGKSTKKGRAVIATILFAAIVGSISAGEVELEWNDPQDERIDGYSIGYGTEFGSYEEIGTTDADARTFMVTGLEDCAVYFFSIVATSETAPDSVDAATVAGWPSMTVTAAHRVDYPVPGKRIFFIFGSNYMDGVRVESFDEEITGEVVGSNCTSTMILLSVPVGAHGVHDLRLVNPDQTFVDFTVRLGQPL